MPLKSETAEQVTTPAAPAAPTPADIEFDVEAPESTPASTVVQTPEPEAPPAPVATDDRQRDEAGRFLPKTYTHSKRLSRMAADLGIPQDEIEHTPSENLDDLVYYLNEQRLQLLQESRMTRQGEAAPQQAAPAKPVEEEPDLGINEEDFDPRIYGVLKKLAQENASLKKEIGGIHQSNKTREQQQLDFAFDQAFAALSPAQQEFFGKGRLGKLTPEQFSRRQAAVAVAKGDPRGIVDAANILSPSAGTPAPAAPTNGQSYVDETLAKRRTQWAEGGVAKPTNREGSPEPKGVAKAKKAFTAGIRALGLDDDFGPSEETQELPG